MLNDIHRKLLLQIARDSITTVLDGRGPVLDASSYDEVLHRPAGAFVTLRRGEELRGCIGSIRAVEALYQAVSSSAISAAFRDPRFRPVRREEMAHLTLEISVMGPIEHVRDTEEIVVGRDGLIVTRGNFAGLLLPQVATEYGWDRVMFLRQTCVKAGLPPESWRHADCRVEKFSAEVFGEE